MLGHGSSFRPTFASDHTEPMTRILDDDLAGGMATRAIYGEDLLIAGGLDYKAYTKMLGERASSQKVNADRKAALTKP